MTAFQINQQVMVQDDTQGFVRGVVYIITDIAEYPTAFGNFVTYYLKDGFNKILPIRNGHLLLKAL